MVCSAALFVADYNIFAGRGEPFARSPTAPPLRRRPAAAANHVAARAGAHSKSMSAARSMFHTQAVAGRVVYAHARAGAIGYADAMNDAPDPDTAAAPVGDVVVAASPHDSESPAIAPLAGDAPAAERAPALPTQPPAEPSSAGGAIAMPPAAATAVEMPAAPAGSAGEAAAATPAIGVLLVNLGTPDAAEPPAVRRYLKEFLTDPRVIENNTLFWRALLNGLVLPVRSRRKARDYRKIWNRDKDESPIKTITRSQAEKLAGILEPLGRHVIVDWAMRYASPSIASRLQALIDRGCERILVMPLYPQYAAATTATVADEVFRFLMRLRRQPALRILPPYYDDPYYIEVLASSLKAELKGLSFVPDVILASYHGMPEDYVRKGDPYASQCTRTTELLRAQLGMDESKLMMTFQSRFGRARWLQPYTIKTVKALAKKGVKNLAVITPGFAADCLETLEEIAVENARVFKRYGGENFVAIPCLNDGEAGMLMIWQLAMRELKGWV
jgi:protoporphyrin/coproporphyrin ferrochelatase